MKKQLNKKDLKSVTGAQGGLSGASRMIAINLANEFATTPAKRAEISKYVISVDKVEEFNDILTKIDSSLRIID